MKLNGINFETNLSRYGVLRSLTHFIDVNCTTPSMGNCESVFLQNTTEVQGNIWKSENDPNAYYEVTFKEGFFYPTNGAMFSCNTNECLFNFTVFGKEKGHSHFTQICEVDAKKDAFKQVFNSFSCISSIPLTALRLKQRGENSSGTQIMQIYMLDFYGFLSFGHCSNQFIKFSLFPSGFFCFLIL